MDEPHSEQIVVGFCHNCGHMVVCDEDWAGLLTESNEFEDTLHHCGECDNCDHKDISLTLRLYQTTLRRYQRVIHESNQ
jgi:hypothetical protein